MHGGRKVILQDLIDETTSAPEGCLFWTGREDEDRPRRPCPSRSHARLLLRTLVARPCPHQTGRLPVLSAAQTVPHRAALRRRAPTVVSLRGPRAPVHWSDPHGYLPPV